MQQHTLFIMTDHTPFIGADLGFDGDSPHAIALRRVLPIASLARFGVVATLNALSFPPFFFFLLFLSEHPAVTRKGEVHLILSLNEI